jgi:receptor expression-enhancing protein 5/6
MSSSIPQTPPSKTALAAKATVEKAMKSINVFIEKNSMLDDATRSFAKSSQKLVQTYAPQMLEYLPEKQIGKEFIFVVGICFILLILFYLGAARIIVDITGIMYPCYATILAIESPTKDDDKQWLTYWIIYVTLKLTDPFTYPILRVIPTYTLIRVILMAWLYHPDFLGAKLIYKKIQPYVMKLILYIEPDFNPTTASSKLKSLNKNHSLSSGNGSVKKSPKKTSSAGDDNNDNDNENPASLIVKILQVDVQKESNIYVEGTILPKDGRKCEGIEGTCYKTNKILGKSCVIDHTMTFLPLNALDGTLKLEILEKPTFTEAISLGTGEISLLGLVPGGPCSSQILNFTNKAIMKIEVELKVNQDISKIDNYTGDRNANGQKHGFGSMNYANGESYKGDWFKDMKHGSGVMIHKDMTKYVGNFFDGLKQGKGEMTDSTGSVIFSGEWWHDTPKK